MANCPLCSDILLRHIRSSQTYWLCRRCRLEILEKNYPYDRNRLPLLPIVVEVERSLATYTTDVSIDRLKSQRSSLTTEV